MPFIVATYVYGSSQGQRTHSARTKMPFIVATYVYASSQGQRTHSARTNLELEEEAAYNFAQFICSESDMNCLNILGTTSLKKLID